MENEIIVIIDPQKDFISDSGAYAKRHSGISQIMEAKENINKLLKNQDKQKAIIVISDYSKNQFAPGLSICIPGTEGHRIDLDLNDNYKIFVKREHSCFSSDAFTDFLQRENISKLLLCGFLAEYCVKETAIDGLKKGFEITLMEGCIGTGDDVQHRKKEMFAELRKAGAVISNEL